MGTLVQVQVTGAKVMMVQGIEIFRYPGKRCNLCMLRPSWIQPLTRLLFVEIVALPLSFFQRFT